MTTVLDDIIMIARTLPPRDKWVLLQILSDDLQHATLGGDTSLGFWTAPTLDEIAAVYPAQPVEDIHTLAVDFWPDDETADQINSFVATQRTADRVSHA